VPEAVVLAEARGLRRRAVEVPVAEEVVRARVVSEEGPRREAAAQGHRPRRERSPEAPPVPERGRRMTVSAVCVAVSAVWLAVLALTNARNTSGGLVLTAAPFPLHPPPPPPPPFPP